MKILLLSILSLFISCFAQAKQQSITIVKPPKDKYVYSRVQIKVLSRNKDQQAALMGATNDFLILINSLLKKYPALNNGALEDRINNTYNFNRDIADLISKYLEYNSSFQSDNQGFPSAFMIFAGFDIEVKGIPSFLSLGAAFVPFMQTKIEAQTGKVVDTKLEYDISPFIWISAKFYNFQTGQQIKIQNFRIGGGLIWGGIEKASDFGGVPLGLAGYIHLPGVAYISRLVKWLPLPKGISVKPQILLTGLSKPLYFFSFAFEGTRPDIDQTPIDGFGASVSLLTGGMIYNGSEKIANMLASVFPFNPPPPSTDGSFYTQVQQQQGYQQVAGAPPPGATSGTPQVWQGTSTTPVAPPDGAENGNSPQGSVNSGWHYTPPLPPK